MFPHPLFPFLENNEDSQSEHILSAILRLALLQQPDIELVELGQGIWMAGTSLCVLVTSRLEAGNLLLRRLNPPKSDIQQVVVVGHSKSTEPSFRFYDALQQLLAHFATPESIPTRWVEKEELLNLALDIPALALRYLPNLIEQGEERRARIDRVRNAYNHEFLKLYGKIQFIGLSVYKEEASSGVEMERIYIPLRLVPEGTAPADDVIRTDPLTLLGPGGRHVILGEPGCGKSTLLRFLALVGFYPPLRQRFRVPGDGRLPLYVVLRHFADELKQRPQLEIGDYLIETTQGFLGVDGFDREFLDYYLEMGEAVVFWTWIHMVFQ